jgi:hypothetical protein
MPTDGDEDLNDVKRAVGVMREVGMLTAARLAEEMGCSRMRALRLLTVAASSDVWGPNIFQRRQGGGAQSTAQQFVYYEPSPGNTQLVATLRALQQTVARLEAKMDSLPKR